MAEKKKYFYDFYKSPDGDDCLEKFYYATKYGTVTGLYVSFFDIGAVTFPKTIPGGIERILYHTPTYAAMGAAFAAAVCFSGQIRKKNDFFNHAIGGFAIGTIHGAKCSSALKGTQLGGLLAVILGTLKYFKDHDLPFMRKVSRKYNEYRPRYDFSIKIYDDPGRPLDP